MLYTYGGIKRFTVIDATALYNLIKNGESGFLECKIAPPRYAELAERVCGMANGLGGYIVLGVSNETWEIAGVKDIGAALDNIVMACRHCKPPVRLEADQPQQLDFEENVSIVAAYIPPNNGTLYQASGIFWVRHGTQTVPLEADEIEKFFHRRGSLSWETRSVRLAGFEDLNTELIEEFARSRTNRRRQSGSGKPLDIGRFLEQLGCAAPLTETAKDTPLYPTNAGLLLFGYSPQDYLIQTETVCVLFGERLGTRRYLDRQIFHGNLATQIDQVEDWLKKNVQVGAYTEGFRRVDDPEYPLEALREAVVNALLHRDYSLAGEAVRVFMYPDRVEIHSPGLLLPGIRLDDLRNGKVSSHPRNPVLANTLRDFPGGYAERLGSGISFMLEQMRMKGKPDPEFIEQNEFIVVFRKEAVVEQERKTPSPQVKLPSKSSQSEEAAAQRYRLALEYITTNGSITNREYRAITGASERTATRDLEMLVEQGSLRAFGSRRSRKYQK
jgi:ATP-dependent DNA helicase RecG